MQLVSLQSFQKPAVSGLLHFALFICLILVAGCGGSSSPVPTASPADFTLSVSPATASVTAGSTSQLQVSITAESGFAQSVAVTLSGLPAGVTADKSSFNILPSAKQTVNLTASAGAAAAANQTLTLTGVSGALSHTASVSLSVTAAPAPPAPDFSLSIAPDALTITQGAATQTMVSVAAVNGFTGSVTLALTGFPSGVTVTPQPASVSSGAPLTLTFTSSTAAVVGSSTVTVTGTSGALSHTATLTITIAAVAVAPLDVLTYHNDNTRQGTNSHESVLTLANVNAKSFGLLATYLMDGKVDAEPLYVSGVNTASGSANVLYVATEHDSLYALNASTGTQVWKASVLGSNETTSDDHSCNQITPEIGITSTPVIDQARGPNGAIFVVGMTKDSGGKYHQRLHSLDLATGAELSGSPVEIAATYPGTGDGSSNGTASFAPGQYSERAGLLLLNGTIYTAWTSHCDYQPYTGWVIGYDENSLKQNAVLNLTPNGNEGSIWMAGYGMAADSDSNIYFLDANGTLDTGSTIDGFPDEGDYGNAMVKLSTKPKLAVSDYFEPYNTVIESNNDQDLGSGGAMVLPDLPDSTGTMRHLLVGAGKDGNVYLADRDNMGKINRTSQDNTNIYQVLPVGVPHGVFSGPAYFNNTVYFGGVNDPLQAFPVKNALLAAAASSSSATVFGYPGTTPSISANGTGNGIVWALESGTGKPAVLHAYDATDLTKELYNSTQSGGRDTFGNGNKFITPMVADGQVFVGTPNAVAVFGLLKPQ